MALCSVVVLDVSVFEDRVIEQGHERTILLNKEYFNAPALAGEGVIQVDAFVCLLYVCKRQKIRMAPRD